jgi:mRNA interferase MazF
MAQRAERGSHFCEFASRVNVGTRPVLVISMTITQAAMRFAGTTLIQPTVENGLRQGSVALVFHLRAIDRQRIQERIGVVSAEDLNTMFEELGKLMGRSV